MGIVPIMQCACSLTLLKRHIQPLKQKSGFAPVTSHCGNAVAKLMQEINSLRTPILPVTSQASRMIMWLRASSSYFLIFKDTARSAAEPASNEVIHGQIRSGECVCHCAVTGHTTIALPWDQGGAVCTIIILKTNIFENKFRFIYFSLF